MLFKLEQNWECRNTPLSQPIKMNRTKYGPPSYWQPSLLRTKPRTKFAGTGSLGQLVVELEKILVLVRLMGNKHRKFNHEIKAEYTCAIRDGR